MRYSLITVLALLAIESVTARDAAASGKTSYNITAGGAACDGTTDDTVSINNYLASLPNGSVVIIPAGQFCLINSANLTVPAGIVIEGGGGPIQPYAGGAHVGTGILLNPLYTILPQNGAQLESLAILRSTLIPNPTVSQATAAISQWGGEASVGVSIVSNATGVSLNKLFIEGFNTGVLAATGEFSLSTLFIDSYNGIKIGALGDSATISDIHIEPFYALNLAGSSGARARPGIGLTVLGPCLISRVFMISYYTGFLVNNSNDVHIFNSGFEWDSPWQSGSTATGSVGIRLVGNTGGFQAYGMDLTTFTTAVSVEGTGPAYFDGITAPTDTTTGPAFDLGGQTPAPALLTVTGTPAAGNQISAIFTGPFSGAPITVTYTLTASDTLATAASGLVDAILHTDQLIPPRISATSSSNAITVRWPETLSLTVTNSSSGGGASITQTTLPAIAGSYGNLYNINLAGRDVIPAFSIGYQALRWVIDGPYFHYNSLPAGWLSVVSPSTSPLLSNIPWAPDSAANLSSCGSSGPTIIGNDGDGTLIEGANATGCTLTFTTPFWEAPTCTISSPNGAPYTGYNPSATALSITNLTASGNQYTYHCRPN